MKNKKRSNYLRCKKSKNREEAIHYLICLNRNCSKRETCNAFEELREFLIKKYNELEEGE